MNNVNSSDLRSRAGLELNKKIRQVEKKKTQERENRKITERVRGRDKRGDVTHRGQTVGGESYSLVKVTAAFTLNAQPPRRGFFFFFLSPCVHQ